MRTTICTPPADGAQGTVKMSTLEIDRDDDLYERRATRAAPPPSTFASFWAGGFESACHIARRGRVDMIACTQHDRWAEEDYALLRRAGIRTARDTARWHLIDRDGRYDFSSFLPSLRAAQRHGVQVIWNLFHYGWPDGLDLFSGEFIDRFARFCSAVARCVADHVDEPPFYTPVNEISFFSWAAGHDGNMHPFTLGKAGQIKRQLVRAAVAGCEAIWEVDRRARFVHTDPLIHVVTPLEFPELWSVAESLRLSQFESWDMLSGRREPDLGGREEYLDIMGVNFYGSNQWDVLGGFVLWHVLPRDERWVPLHQLLRDLYERYRRPIFIAETGHVGVGRAPWIREIADEVVLARDAGVPVEGVCLYPVLDRHDWDDESHWHNSGLWELVDDGRGKLQRIVCKPYMRELRRAQRLLRSRGCV